MRTSAGAVLVLLAPTFLADLGGRRETLMVAKVRPPVSLELAIRDLQIVLRKDDRLPHHFSGEYLPAIVWSEDTTTYAVLHVGE